MEKYHEQNIHNQKLEEKSKGEDYLKTEWRNGPYD